MKKSLIKSIGVFGLIFIGLFLGMTTVESQDRPLEGQDLWEACGGGEVIDMPGANVSVCTCNNAINGLDFGFPNLSERRTEDSSSTPRPGEGPADHYQNSDGDWQFCPGGYTHFRGAYFFNGGDLSENNVSVDIRNQNVGYCCPRNSVPIFDNVGGRSLECCAIGESNELSDDYDWDNPYSPESNQAIYEFFLTRYVDNSLGFLGTGDNETELILRTGQGSTLFNTEGSLGSGNDQVRDSLLLDYEGSSSFTLVERDSTENENLNCRIIEKGGANTELAVVSRTGEIAIEESSNLYSFEVFTQPTQNCVADFPTPTPAPTVPGPGGGETYNVPQCSGLFPDAEIDEGADDKANSSCNRISDRDERFACARCECSASENVWTEIGCVESTASGIVNRAFQIGVGIMGAVIIFRIFQVVVLLANPSADQNNVEEAREIIISLISFIIFLAASVVGLRFLGYNVLDIGVPIFGLGG